MVPEGTSSEKREENGMANQMTYSIYRVTEDGRELIGQGLAWKKMATAMEEATQKDRETGESAEYEVTREEESPAVGDE